MITSVNNALSTNPKEDTVRVSRDGVLDLSGNDHEQVSRILLKGGFLKGNQGRVRFGSNPTAITAQGGEIADLGGIVNLEILAGEEKLRKFDFSGENTFQGSVIVYNDMAVIADNDFAVSRSAEFIAKDNSFIDFSGHKQHVDEFKLLDNSRLSVSAKKPFKVKEFVMDSEGGGIDVDVFEKVSDAPIEIEGGGRFNYKKGTLNVNIPVDPKDIDPEGDWMIIEGDIMDEDGNNLEDKLAQNTVVTINGTEYPKFEGLGSDYAILGASALYQGYLNGGSLKLVIAPKGKIRLIASSTQTLKLAQTQTQTQIQIQSQRHARAMIV